LGVKPDDVGGGRRPGRRGRGLEQGFPGGHGESGKGVAPPWQRPGETERGEGGREGARCFHQQTRDEIARRSDKSDSRLAKTRDGRQKGGKRPTKRKKHTIAYRLQSRLGRNKESEKRHLRSGCGEDSKYAKPGKLRFLGDQSTEKKEGKTYNEFLEQLARVRRGDV